MFACHVCEGKSVILDTPMGHRQAYKNLDRTLSPKYD